MDRLETYIVHVYSQYIFQTQTDLQYRSDIYYLKYDTKENSKRWINLISSLPPLNINGNYKS